MGETGLDTTEVTGTETEVSNELTPREVTTLLGETDLVGDDLLRDEAQRNAMNERLAAASSPVQTFADMQAELMAYNQRRAEQVAELLAPLVTKSPEQAAAALYALKKAIEIEMEESAKREAAEKENKSKKEEADRLEKDRQARDLRKVQEESRGLAQSLLKEMSPTEALALISALSTQVGTIDGRNEGPISSVTGLDEDPAIEAQVNLVLKELHEYYDKVIAEVQEEEAAREASGDATLVTNGPAASINPAPAGTQPGSRPGQTTQPGSSLEEDDDAAPVATDPVTL